MIDLTNWFECSYMKLKLSKLIQDGPGLYQVVPRCSSMFFDVPRCFQMFPDVPRCSYRVSQKKLSLVEIGSEKSSRSFDKSWRYPSTSNVWHFHLIFTLKLNLVMSSESRSISRRCLRSREWPPRSPDLSPLNYFLWGLLMLKVNSPCHPQPTPGQHLGGSCTD